MLIVVVFLSGCATQSNVIGQATSSDNPTQPVLDDVDYLEQIISYERAIADASELISDSSRNQELASFADDQFIESDSDVISIEYAIGAYYPSASSDFPQRSTAALAELEGAERDEAYIEQLLWWESQKLELSQQILDANPQSYARELATDIVDSYPSTREQLNAVFSSIE